MKLKQLKKIIQETVRDTLQAANKEKEVQMGGAYRMKEDLMKAVQDSIRANSDLIESQNEYEDMVDQELKKLKEDLDLTLSMIGRALYQVPFQAFKGPGTKSK